MNYLVFVYVDHWFGGYGAMEPGFEDVLHYTEREDVLNKLVEIWADHGMRGVDVDFVVCENYEQVINHFKNKYHYPTTDEAKDVKEILVCENEELRIFLLSQVKGKLLERTNNKLKQLGEENRIKKEKRIKELQKELEELNA